MYIMVSRLVVIYGILVVTSFLFFALCHLVFLS